MTRTTLAIAADYADAMLVARRAKNWLFLVLLLVLLTQLALFFVARFPMKEKMREVRDREHDRAAAAAVVDAATAASPATEPAAATATATTTTVLTPAPSGPAARPWVPVMEYVINVTDFLGVTMVGVLGVVLLLLVTIMLVGRLVGVAQLTGAFVWCVLLGVFLFPWQALLNRTPNTPDVPDFKLPGVLYTWPELRDHSDFANAPVNEAILKWARFVGWPVASIVILLVLQVRSNRGLRLALGESDVTLDPSVPTGT